MGILLAERSHLSELAPDRDARLGPRLRDDPRADALEADGSLAAVLEAGRRGVSGLSVGASLAAPAFSVVHPAHLIAAHQHRAPRTSHPAPWTRHPGTWHTCHRARCARRTFHVPSSTLRVRTDQPARFARSTRACTPSTLRVDT